MAIRRIGDIPKSEKKTYEQPKNEEMYDSFVSEDEYKKAVESQPIKYSKTRSIGKTAATVGTLTGVAMVTAPVAVAAKTKKASEKAIDSATSEFQYWLEHMLGIERHMAPVGSVSNDTKKNGPMPFKECERNDGGLEF